MRWPTKSPSAIYSPPTRPDSLGRLGHYEVQEVLGRGAFGIVLKAFDEKLHRVVAIKVLSPEMAATSPARKRFLREARSSAQVRHECVVSIHAVEDEPIPYLVMEYIPGKTLQQRLDEQGPLDLTDVLRLGRQVAEGLAAAHSEGLIHRDVKPGNILLETSIDDRVKLTDFGMARTADDASMTQSGLIAGTPMYMAPEQAQGQRLDQRADLFSFGSVLYQMLSGRPPFRAPSTVAVLKRVVDDTPRPIREIIPEVPEWMCEIVSHLHAKDPDQRYGSAKEVARLLERCLADVKAGRVPDNLGPACAAKESDRQPAETKRPVETDRVSRRSATKVAAAALILLVGLGITEATGVTRIASTVIRLTTGSGILIIESDDPGVTIAVDGEEVTITGGGVKELTLRPGEYKVAAFKEGQPVKQELVSITRNGRTSVRMTLEPVAEVKTLTDLRARLVPDWTLQGMLRLGPELDRLLANGNFSESDVNQCYDVALGFGRGADWSRAVRLLDLGIERSPQSFWSWMNRYFAAAAFEDSAGIQASRDRLTRLLAGSVQDVNANVAAARVLCSSETNESDLQDARGIAKRLAENWPNDVSSLCARAQVRYVTNDFAGCRELLDEIPPVAGNVFFRIRVTLLEAETAFQLGDQEEAEERLAVASEMVQSLHSSGQLSPRDCLVIGESVGQLRDAERAIHGEPRTPLLTPLRLAELSGKQLSGDLQDLARSASRRTTDNGRLAQQLADAPPTDDYALAFMSKEDRVDLPTLANQLNAGPLTIEAYVTFGPGELPDGQKTSIFRDKSGMYAHLQLHKSWRFWRATASLGPGIVADQTPLPGERTHVAAVWDGRQSTLFVNGERQAVSPVHVEGLTFDGVTPPWIGGVGRPESLKTFVPYTIDELRISRVARYTNDFIPAVRHNPDGQTLALYHFDDAVGNVLTDSSGNGHYGTIVGATWRKVEGTWATEETPDIPSLATNSQFPPGSAADILTSDEYEWTEPVNLGPLVNSPQSDRNACVSSDGLTLLFRSGRPDGQRINIWECRRSRIDETWSQPTKLAQPINAAHFQGDPKLSADGKTLMFISTNAGDSSDPEGHGKLDIWSVTRESIDGPWGKPRNLGPQVNSEEHEGNPILSAGGLQLVFTSNRNGHHEKFSSSRPTPQDGWSTPTKLPEAPVAGGINQLLDGGRTVLFTHGGLARWDAANMTWGEAYDVSPPIFEGEEHTKPYYDQSTQTLYFESTRPGGEGEYDLWMSRRVRKSNTTAVTPLSPGATAGSSSSVVKDGWQDWPADAPPPAAAPFDAEQAKAHQEAWAKYLGVPVEYENSLGMKLRLIPPGEFLMRQDYEVTITESFQIGIHEVTIAQFRAFVEETGYETSAEVLGNGQRVSSVVARISSDENRSAAFTWRHEDVHRGDDHPVAQLSWDDAAALCEWLSDKEGRLYRLPTEAERQWAARAGSLNDDYFFDNPSKLDEYAWFDKNSKNQTHPVGLKLPNAWGLFDVHGNVCEYCRDWHGDELPSGQASDPVGPTTGQFRMMRGGGYIDTPAAVAFGYRGAFGSSGSLNHFGMRVVCEVVADREANELPNIETSSRSASRVQQSADVLLRRTDSPFPPGSAADLLTSGEYEWTKPVNLGPRINTAGSDNDVCVSEDGLTLLFNSLAPGGAGGGNDLFQSTRESVGDDWTAAVPLAINSAQSDLQPTLSSDGLTLIFASTREGRGKYDLWEATRESSSEAWSEPDNLGSTVNSPDSDWFPRLSEQGLRLDFVRQLESGQWTRWMTTRPTRDGAWSDPEPVKGLEGTSIQLLDDGTTALGTDPNLSCYVALWSPSQKRWNKKMTLPLSVNDGHSFRKPYFHSATRTLYFDSGRPGGQGGQDLWSTRLVQNEKSAEAPRRASSEADAAKPAQESGEE